MKVYLIKDEDLDRLRALVDRDPAYGFAGGSNVILTQQEREAHERAHRFFHYQIHTWIDAIARSA